MVARPTVQRGRSGFDERGRGEVIYGERSNQRERTVLSRPLARSLTRSRPVRRQLRSLYCSLEIRTTMKKKEENEGTCGAQDIGRRSQLGLRLCMHYARARRGFTLFFLLPSPSNSVSMPHNPHSTPSYERRANEIGLDEPWTQILYRWQHAK